MIEVTLFNEASSNADDQVVPNFYMREAPHVDEVIWLQGAEGFCDRKGAKVRTAWKVVAVCHWVNVKYEPRRSSPTSSTYDVEPIHHVAVYAKSI